MDHVMRIVMLKVVSVSVRQTMPDELVKNVTMVTTITQIATVSV